MHAAAGLRQGKWSGLGERGHVPADKLGGLRGLTLGTLGAGSIATHTARLAKAFGMRTVALRRNARKSDDDGAFDLVLGPYDGPILPAHKKALFEQCDVVVSTLPGTPETKHFVSTAEFNAMKPGAIFISLGRGIAVAPSMATDADVDAMMSINVKSALYGMQAVLPHFKQQGGGHIINVSSRLGRIPSVLPRSVYNWSKHFLNGLTTNFRDEVCVCVCVYAQRQAHRRNAHASLVAPAADGRIFI